MSRREEVICDGCKKKIEVDLERGPATPLEWSDVSITFVSDKPSLKSVHQVSSHACPSCTEGLFKLLDITRSEA